MGAIWHYVGEMLPWMLIGLPVYLTARYIRLRRNVPPRIPWLREGLLLCFVLFCIGLASQTVLPEFTVGQAGIHADTVFSRGWEDRRQGVNLRPFFTISSYFARGNGELFLINILGNIGIFVPLGFFPPLLWKRWRKWYRTALLGLGVSAAVECLQIFTFRSVDVDDVILNTLGALLGYACFALLRFLRRRIDSKGAHDV